MFSQTCAHSRRFAAAAGLTLAFCAASAVLIPTSSVVAQVPSCYTTTASGDVQGLLRGGTCSYLGIPYAAPPTGNLRWRPPQPRAPWAPAPLIATSTAPPVCAQIGAGVGAAINGVEDCLTLNIWAPATVPPGRGLPVMVWLHGGDFRATSANATEGRRFAEEQNAIVVGANYRLGPFGFLAHNALTLEDGGYPSSGNYGLADQRTVLRWVKNNIAVFGGDPDNVTLFGQSSGAVSTSLHLVSPFSRGLFHRAIMQSGQASHRWRTSAEAEAQGDAVAAALGCTDRAQVLTCMRSASRDQVLRALITVSQQFHEEPDRVQWGPVVDGLEIPDQPRELFRRGQFSRMPIMIGANRDEGWNYVDRSFPGNLDALQYERVVRTEFGMDADAVLRIYPVSAFATPKDALARLTGDAEVVCEARRVARALHHDGAPVYVYSFEYVVDAVLLGRAFHGLEVNFVFGINFGAPSNHVLAASDLALFRSISTYWRQFAETGSPNHPDNPVEWPLFRAQPSYGSAPVDPSTSDRYMVLDERIGAASYLRDSQCNFWEQFYFRSLLGTVPAAAR